MSIWNANIMIVTDHAISNGMDAMLQGIRNSGSR